MAGWIFLGADDRALLIAAATENKTLVTYDQKTIPTLLAEFAAAS